MTSYDERHDGDGPDGIVSTIQASGPEQIKPTKPAQTPLPKLQLGILALVRLAEPISYTNIFPFVNEMMLDLKVTDNVSQVGFYSGAVDSSFAVAQLFTIFIWGRLSDRIGRRPVIFTGLSGVATSSLLFGLSRSLTWAVASRSIAGALSGNVAVIQSMIGELTDATNQHKAFPLSAITWSVGTVLGPILGSSLYKPAERLPRLFGHSTFLRTYPAFLPCFVSSLITTLALLFGYYFLKETLPSKVAKKTSPFDSSARNYGATTTSLPPPTLSGKTETTTATPSARFILSRPIIQSLFASGFLLSFLAMGFNVVFILMSATPIHLGGLSRTPAQIGYALAGGGIFSILVLPFGFPPLQHRFGSVPLYRFLMLLWPLLFLSLPFMNQLARRLVNDRDTLSATNATIMWIAIGAEMVVFRLASMNFSVNLILVKNAAPSKEALGSTNGLSQSVYCVARALSPAFVSSLFAVSVERQLLHGNAVWVILVALGLVGVKVSSRIRDGADVPENI